ncbi:MAG: hypothetical protein GW802_35055, partial [Armatimonadetes bacterium]|nr:hypothetical protein [Armatimonadota bacterium]
SSGGILGAEGAVRLLLTGSAESVKAALALCQSIHGEPSFLEQCEAARV